MTLIMFRIDLSQLNENGKEKTTTTNNQDIILLEKKQINIRMSK